MRIIFMGTPDFAVASLRQLVENGCEVVAVVTAPDKPSGRGLKMHETPVKQYAVSKGIPVLQPEKLRDQGFLSDLRAYHADLQVVVAFRMLPEVVWAMPPKGTFNLHGSLLPQYRGAAPVNWALINGEAVTGVTTFFIEKEIDTGKIIFSRSTPVTEEDDAGTLHDRLMDMGAELVLDTVRAIENGSYPRQEQQMSDPLKSAPKIFRETCEIDWNRPGREVFNFIRGLSPYPAAWTFIGDKVAKIYKAAPAGVSAEEKPDLFTFGEGQVTIATDHKKRLLFKVADGWLEVSELQLEGKKRMTTEEFLRGYRF